MVNVVAATYGAIARDVILARVLAAAEEEQLEMEQVEFIKKVCEGKAKPPKPFLAWLEGLMPGVTKTIGEEINRMAIEMLKDGEAAEE